MADIFRAAKSKKKQISQSLSGIWQFEKLYQGKQTKELEQLGESLQLKHIALTFVPFFEEKKAR